jgi:hypothetical protein
MSKKPLENQVAEFNYQLAITNRLKELTGFKEKAETELQQAQQFIQQKTAELNALLGAIGELEKLIASTK